MSSSYMNEVAAMIDSMDISDTMMLGAGAIVSKRLQQCVSTDRAQSVAPGADKLAKQLSNYDIYKTISTGSSCSVYIGQRAGSCAPVAVKVMKAQKRSKLSKQGLTMEIKCLKKVQASGKRCFVKVVESFVDRYNHYIVFVRHHPQLLCFAFTDLAFHPRSNMCLVGRFGRVLSEREGRYL